MAPKLADVAGKFDAMVQAGESVMATMGKAGYGPHTADAAATTMWSVNALTLVRSVFGSDSEYYKLMAPYSKGQNNRDSVTTVQAVLKAARAGWADGYVFSLEGLVRADVEADLLQQAKDLLDQSYERAAAVVVGAVVEEHLRTVAPSWSVAMHDSKGKALTMEPLNIEMKKAGAYDGIMQKRITLFGGIRNKAAHGETFDNRAADVESMIADAVRICGEVKSK